MVPKIQVVACMSTLSFSFFQKLSHLFIVSRDAGIRTYDQHCESSRDYWIYKFARPATVKLINPIWQNRVVEILSVQLFQRLFL